jgi:uncharacterized membrane protein YhaH (DUF805 family)
VNWYFQVLTKYTELNGKSRRSEYWCFDPFNILISLVIYFINAGIREFGALGFIYSLGILIPVLILGLDGSVILVAVTEPYCLMQQLT